MVAPNSPLSHTCGACWEACCAARADGMGIAPLSVECHIKDPVPNMSEGSSTPIPSPRMFGGVYGQCYPPRDDPPKILTRCGHCHYRLPSGPGWGCTSTLPGHCAEETIKGSLLTAEQINKAAAAAPAAAKPMTLNTYKLDLARGLIVRAFQQVA